MTSRLLLVTSFVSIVVTGTAHAQTEAPASTATPQTAPATPATPAAAPPDAPPATPHAAAPVAPVAPVAPPTPAPADDVAEPGVDPEPPKSFDPKKGPINGFVMQGRLSQAVAPVTVGTASSSSSSGAFAFAPTIPAVSFGIRGERAVVAIGPTFSRSEYDVAPGVSESVTILGATLHLEIDVFQTRNRKNEAYLLLGGSLMLPSISHPAVSSSTFGGTPASSDDDGISGELAYGALVGFGARHWLSRNLGVHVEIGESLLDIPAGKVYSAGPSGSSPSKDNARANILSTFGTLGISIVL